MPLEQCSSNCSVHTNHLGVLIKGRISQAWDGGPDTTDTAFWQAPRPCYCCGCCWPMAQALSGEAWSYIHYIEACFYNSSGLHLYPPPKLDFCPLVGCGKTERCWDERMALFTNNSNKRITSFRFTSFLQRYSLYFSHLSSFWAFKGLKRPETVRESSLFMAFLTSWTWSKPCLMSTYFIQISSQAHTHL